MPTLIQGALRPNDGRATANPVSYQAPGTYQQSVINAFLVTVSGTPGNYDVTNAAVVAGTTVPLLLFCSDKPVYLRADSMYDNATLTDSGAATVTLPAPTYKEAVFGSSAAATVPFAALTPATTQAGGVFRGTTNTGNVRVDGYIANVLTLDRGLVNSAQGALTCDVEIEGIYQSGVIDGFVTNYVGNVAGGQVSATQIIMQEALYTQAMQTAGDTFTVGGAPNTLIQVVGLYQLP